MRDDERELVEIDETHEVTVSLVCLDDADETELVDLRDDEDDDDIFINDENLLVDDETDDTLLQTEIGMISKVHEEHIEVDDDELLHHIIHDEWDDDLDILELRLYVILQNVDIILQDERNIQNENIQCICSKKIELLQHEHTL